MSLILLLQFLLDRFTSETDRNDYCSEASVLKYSINFDFPELLSYIQSFVHLPVNSICRYLEFIAVILLTCIEQLTNQVERRLKQHDNNVYPSFQRFEFELDFLKW